MYHDIKAYMTANVRVIPIKTNKSDKNVNKL